MTVPARLDWMTDPLVLPVLFPLLAGLLCLVLPRDAKRLRGLTAVAAAAVTVVLVWPLFAAGGALFEPTPWLSLRVDALSGFVLLAVAVCGFLVAVYSAGYMRAQNAHRAYFCYLLSTVGLACGAVLANDLIVLLVFWGLLALALYLMIGLAGTDAADAARKSLMIVGGADALMVLGVVLLWTLTGSTRMDAGSLPISDTASQIAFLTFVAAAFAKTGAVPFHAWVPDCGAKALIPVTAFLPASLDKLLGIYLLVRCVDDLFEMTTAMQTMLMVLGAVTLLAGGLMALIQRDLKLLLAYSSISQVGYIVLGIGCGTPLGMAAALFHMLNNTIYKGCLFLCAGAVQRAAGTTDLDRLGGLGRAMPVTFGACLVAALAASGVPPLSGFASKWMIYQSLIESGDVVGPTWIVMLAAAMVGSALTLAAAVKLLHATFLCKPAPNIAERSIGETGVSMLAPIVTLATGCVVFGVFAYAVPLDLLIFPIVPAVVPGVWWAGPATILILVAVGLGGAVYGVTIAAGKLRRCETYVGGERLHEVYIGGEQRGAPRHVEVTGAHFYDSVETLPGLRRVYGLARAKLFDIYELTAKSTTYLVGVLRGVHSGALPAYLTWLLAGALVVLYAVTQFGAGHD